MEKVVFGLAVFIFGWWMELTEFSSADDEFFYNIVGAPLIIGGVVSIAKGISEIKAQRRLTQIQAQHPDLVVRLQQGQSLDEIAADYHTKLGIRPADTLIYAAGLIKDWAGSQDASVRSLGERLIAKQQVREVSPPEQFLDQLSAGRMAIYYDETALGYLAPPSVGVGYQGTLVLSTSYLYFFGNEQKVLSGGLGEVCDVVWDTIGDLPVIGHGAKAIDVAVAAYSEAYDRYDDRRLESLKRRFLSGNGFAVPLNRIVDCRMTETFAPVGCLEVEFKTENEAEPTLYWFASRPVDMFSSAKQIRWTQAWIERIRTAALAQGNNLTLQSKA